MIIITCRNQISLLVKFILLFSENMCIYITRRLTRVLVHDPKICESICILALYYLYYYTSHDKADTVCRIIRCFNLDDHGPLILLLLFIKFAKSVIVTK